MTGVLLMLLCAVWCISGQEINPWGSRVITQNSGPINLNFQYGNYPIPNACPDSAYLYGDDPSPIASITVDIATQQCKYPSAGQPAWDLVCRCQNGTFQIRLRDVTAQKRIVVPYGVDELVAYFVPDCNYGTPKTGDAILQDAVPLSRFLMGDTRVPIRFTMKGTETESTYAELRKNGYPICTFTNSNVAKPVHGSDSPDPKCVNLTVDMVNGVRVFEKTFDKVRGRDNYQWYAGDTSASISVDWEQKGVSTENIDCPISPTPNDPHPPVLWGSRIITVPYGSVKLTLDYTNRPGFPTNPGPNTFIVYKKKSTMEVITIRDGICTRNDGSVWSDQCNVNELTQEATITVPDVTQLQRLVITNDNGEIMAFFAPNCDYKTPGAGEVILRDSTPLSHFAYGINPVTLRFAVEGYTSSVTLTRNGIPFCWWTGVEPGIGNFPNDCGLMIMDITNKLRTVEVQISRLLNGALKENFVFSSAQTYAAISVDWFGQGDSPEDPDCQLPPPPPPPPSPTATEVTTTSAASALVYAVEVNLALVFILLHLEK